MSKILEKVNEIIDMLRKGTYRVTIVQKKNKQNKKNQKMYHVVDVTQFDGDKGLFNAEELIDAYERGEI